MGRIISSRRNNDKIVFELEADYEEAIILKGHYDDVHVFTERASEFQTNISARGKNSATKYFLVPRTLRKNVNYKKPVSCQKIETGDKIVFIYVVDKNGFS